MNLWFYLNGVEQSLRSDQVAYNTAVDTELKGKMEDLMHNIHSPMIVELKEFFKKEGIPLPETTPEKLPGDYKTLPEGAKLTDEEIANLVVFNLVVGIDSAVKGQTESIRADVGYLFLKYQLMKVTFSLSFRAMMEEKGWLRIPPYYFPSNPKI